MVDAVQGQTLGYGRFLNTTVEMENRGELSSDDEAPITNESLYVAAAPAAAA